MSFLIFSLQQVIQSTKGKPLTATNMASRIPHRCLDRAGLDKCDSTTFAIFLRQFWSTRAKAWLM